MNIDRRVIYLLIALAVIIPLLFGWILPIRVSPPVRQAFDAVEGIPEGGVVFISIDFDPSSQPELDPMLIAILRHCFSRDLKVVLMGHMPLGIPLGSQRLEEVAQEFSRTYGMDYANIGYRPGYTAVMVQMGREIRGMFETDYEGTPLDDIPMMQNIHNYGDIDLLIVLAHGATSEVWAQIANSRFGQRMAVGGTAVIAPDLYPYLQSGQIEGIIGGLKGAAEYETLIDRPSVGVVGMVPQSVAHVLILVFIIIGNLGYFYQRRRTRRESGGSV
jgi:hypothetical protein